MHFAGRPNGQAPCSRHSKGVAKCLQYGLSFSFHQQTTTKLQARISGMLCNDFCSCLLFHDVAMRIRLPRVDVSLRRLHQNAAKGKATARIGKEREERVSARGAPRPAVARKGAAAPPPSISWECL